MCNFWLSNFTVATFFFLNQKGGKGSTSWAESRKCTNCLKVGAQSFIRSQGNKKNAWKIFRASGGRLGFRQQTGICQNVGHPQSSDGKCLPAVALRPLLSGRTEPVLHRRWLRLPQPPPALLQQCRSWWSRRGCKPELCKNRQKLTDFAVDLLCLSVRMLLTWPLDLIGISQVYWSWDKHLGIGDGWPERHHVEAAVVADRGVLFWVDNFACRIREKQVTVIICA